jgi:hypothetical protein
MCFTHRRRGLVNGGRLAVAGLLRQRDRVFPHRPRPHYSSGTGQHQSLMVRYPVLRMLSGRASNFPVHSSLVAFQKREVVPYDQKFRDFQFALRRQLQGLRRLFEPVEEKTV